MNANNFRQIIEFFYPIKLKLIFITGINLLYSILRNPSIIHIPDIKLVKLGGKNFTNYNSITTNDLIGFIFDENSIGQRKINSIIRFGQDFLQNYLKV